MVKIWIFGFSPGVCPTEPSNLVFSLECLVSNGRRALLGGIRLGGSATYLHHSPILEWLGKPLAQPSSFCPFSWHSPSWFSPSVLPPFPSWHTVDREMVKTYLYRILQRMPTCLTILLPCACMTLWYSSSLEDLASSSSLLSSCSLKLGSCHHIFFHALVLACGGQGLDAWCC